MRGLPWLRLLSIIVVFAAMGWPVWRLTRPLPAGEPAAKEAATPTKANAPAEAPVLLVVELSFAGPPPTNFQMKQASQIVLQSDGSKGSVFQTQWKTGLPKEGLDLTLEATWPPDGIQSAVRVSVSLPDGRQIQKFYWAGDSLVEVVTIPGSDEQT